MPPLRSQRELWLFRRGAALPRKQARGMEDSERPLSEEGKLAVREAAAGLKSLGSPPDWIVSSPAPHAVETAKILQEVLGPGIRLDITDALRPGEKPDHAIAYLGANKSWKRALAVGHEPELSRIAASLVGASGKTNLRLRKGGCCRIDFGASPGGAPARLVWWMTPKQLRKLA